MKRMTIAVAILLPAVALIAGLAQTTGLEGSKHDFRGEAWAKDDMCANCHLPRREEDPEAAPLWEPSADLTTRFGGASAGYAGATTPGAGSLICMRCHDGTIANLATGEVTSAFANRTNPGMFAVGGGGTDHPIGLAYPDFDDDFQPAQFVLAGGDVVLPGGQIECSSCHDPHNTSGLAFMLVKSNARSALCLTCHKK